MTMVGHVTDCAIEAKNPRDLQDSFRALLFRDLGTFSGFRAERSEGYKIEKVTFVVDGEAIDGWRIFSYITGRNGPMAAVFRWQEVRRSPRLDSYDEVVSSKYLAVELGSAPGTYKLTQKVLNVPGQVHLRWSEIHAALDIE